MTRRVYDLADASAQEVEEVLEVLSEHDIAHYQTPGGIFGLAPGAIWVSNDADYEEARKLIEAHDQARAQRVRAQYAERAAVSGHGPLGATLLNVRRLVTEHPLQALLYAAVLVLLIAFHVLFFKALA
jgi:Family of unknown function (DUF6164)